MSDRLVEARAGRRHAIRNRREQCILLGGPERCTARHPVRHWLRVGELVQLDVEMLDLNEDVLMLPAQVQKDYPNENSPVYTEIGLAPETVRVLQTYRAGRWKDSAALFPSRSADRITTQGVRNVVKQAAVDAEILPYTTNGRGSPGDVTPHTLRHSVAYRMLNREQGNTLYDVTKRLRHATILTTERVYLHFDRV